MIVFGKCMLQANALPPAAPLQFDRELPRLRRRAPRRAGEQTEEILGALGVEAGELAKLRADSIVE